MSARLTPETVEEVVDLVRSSPRVLAVGNETKARLCITDSTKLSMAKLRGILEYEPSEFTFTALAGTLVRDLISALSERGQYLPFDPMLVDAGATLGGTVAAGLSGPGRFRFGGLRDFILGARFVDGKGRLLRLGGKVVKNAAGFDLPKFFVGSLGRFGVIVELTFKVFPVRPTTVTCQLEADNLQQGRQILIEVGRSRFEPDALDLLPDEQRILVRLAGPEPALESMIPGLLTRWPGEQLPAEKADAIWSGIQEFAWAYREGVLVKVPVTPDVLPEFVPTLSSLPGMRSHVSSGGNVAFLALPDGDRVGELADRLSRFSLCSLTLRGDAPLWLGLGPRPQIAQAVKEALDPNGRFPGLYD